MGSLLLVVRLAVKDVRRNPAEAVLLIVAIVAATTTLTVALALHGVTNAAYAATRAATAGPDVVAAVQQGGGSPPSQLTALEHASGVVASRWLVSFAGGDARDLNVDGRELAVRNPRSGETDEPGSG